MMVQLVINVFIVTLFTTSAVTKPVGPGSVVVETETLPSPQALRVVKMETVDKVAPSPAPGSTLGLPLHVQKSDFDDEPAPSCTVAKSLLYRVSRFFLAFDIFGVWERTTRQYAKECFEDEANDEIG